MEFRFPTLQRRWSMGSRVHSFDRSPTLLKQSEVVDIKSTDQWRAYFDASKGNNKLLVIQFTATWCGPCRFIDPAVKEFAAKYTDVEFIKIDVDKFMMVADRFQANTLPAFVLIKKGKEVDRIVGVKKMELQNKIEQHKI
ncbi:thioredoxin H-type 7 [Euphorbia peplus]|nr:thioredoxin H-type 7 [Euphorbia peplus]